MPPALNGAGACGGAVDGAPGPAREEGPGARPGRAGVYVCLVCGSPMDERGCRVRCARCGYFEDCGNGLTPPPVIREPSP